MSGDKDTLSVNTGAGGGGAAPAPPSSSRASPASGLTTFPNPFQDEPEPGLLPSIRSKVKSTFSAATSATTPATASQVTAVKDKDKGVASSSSSGIPARERDRDARDRDPHSKPAAHTQHTLNHGHTRTHSLSREPYTHTHPHPHAKAHAPAQTEAQQIAEAARKQIGAVLGPHASQKPTQPPSRGSQLSIVSGGAVGAGSGGVGGGGGAGGDGAVSPASGSRLSPTMSGQSNASLQLPPNRSGSALTSITGVSALGVGAGPGGPGASAPTSSQASIDSGQTGSAAPSARRHLIPGERNWRPVGAAPAQVTVSPVTSVTTTVPSRLGHAIPSAYGDEGMPPPPPRLGHLGHAHTYSAASHASVPSIDITTAKGRTIPASALGRRPRRGSISTIPDSPSSVSLSAMISANAELSQNHHANYSFVPGFTLPAEDTRSVRSLGITKKPGSVSKIIRRMRGEGLSKHYWMADEACKECYDCKSVFTTWRRKHHCRICGQIFCGRCASNIIGARRFGQDGMVRVCNMCLKIMEEYDDEDDRRSINSGISSLPDRVFTPDMSYQASPFAASQLFTRQANESLSAIDESAATRYWGRNGELPERPYTPEDTSDMSDSEDGHGWSGTTRPGVPAPFRRQHGDDNSDEQHHTHLVQADTPSPEVPDANANAVVATRRRVDFPTDAPQAYFPRTETMDSDDSRGNTLSALPDLSKSSLPHHNSGLRTRLSSAVSLRGLNALLDSEKKDSLWRARTQSFAMRAEFITGPSLEHFNTMLQQSIDRHALQNPAVWHQTLSRLLLRVSTNLRPMVRAGDSIDVRAYVKIKKVPGGRITDSEYVDGIVITKNVAHKGMPRRLVNPRIMVITFPLDYHRNERQFMSLDPIMKQERDYLRLLTKRIIDLRPHIVLVEPFVSRIALEFLHAANIVVARGVKFSAIHQVARCTHADVIVSMDRLALEPRLGRCSEFKVQTFESDLIPGRRKTYMRFEGTHNGFGGTIILRGADLPTLRRVKLIADFLALVAYHLKNETSLYSDEFHMLPPRPPLPHEYQELLRMLADHRADPQKMYGAESDTEDAADPDLDATPRPDDDKEAERADALNLTREIAESLEPYLTTVLSASVAVRFPPPAPLARMAALDRTLNRLRVRRDEKEAEKILLEEKRVPEIKIDLEAASNASVQEESLATTPTAATAAAPPPVTTPTSSASATVPSATPVPTASATQATQTTATPSSALASAMIPATASAVAPAAPAALSVPANAATQPKGDGATPTSATSATSAASAVSATSAASAASHTSTASAPPALGANAASVPLAAPNVPAVPVPGPPPAVSSATAVAHALPPAAQINSPPTLSVAVLPAGAVDTTGAPKTAPLSAVSSNASNAPSLAPISAISGVSGISNITNISGISGISVVGKGATGDPYRVLLNPDDFIDASKLAFVEHDHTEQVKIWQHYVKRNPGPLHPKNYQGIIYLQANYRQGQDKPCTEPTRRQINFYQDGDDHTLGQFLGELVSNAAHTCPNKTCEQLMLFHYDVLVHAERRLQIVMEQFMCPLAGHEQEILTWTYCRQCNKSWEPTVIREETWRMSWGAYLEHCFYPPETRTGFECTHDAYREHIRYFAHHNMVIRIHNDAIELYEPVRPSTKLLVRIEDKVFLKNQEYESALSKTAAFFDSVLHRLRSFADDLVDPDKLPRMRQERDALLARAVADRDEMVNTLNRTYKQTPPTDVLAINVVLQALQDKVIQWDLDFLDVEKSYMPTEKDLRRMTATHLKRLFATQDVFGSLDKSVPEVDEREKTTDTDPSVPSMSKPVSPSLAASVEAALDLPPTMLESPLPSPTIESSASTAETPGKTTTPDSKAGAKGDEPKSDESKADSKDVSSAGDSSEGKTKSETVTGSDVTPTPTVGRVSNPFSMTEAARDYDSDSTVSAFPARSKRKTFVPPERPSSALGNAAENEPQGGGFVSRLPRRTRPAPSVADLVKRFQESVGNQEFETTEPPPIIDRPRSSGGRLRHEPEVSDSDVAAAQPSRPRLRRRGTHDPALRSGSKDGARSVHSERDRERSYAVNASRASSSSASHHHHRRGEGSSSRGRSRAPSPAPSGRRDLLSAPSPRVPMGKSVSHEGKPRLGGKGKTPRKASEPAPSASSLIRGLPRRVGGGVGTRVTSIARHFDKLSREAERDRQKRISLARGKRAGRVGVTKAKVQVFNNVRDAFRDEFDSDSSVADNEADEGEDQTDGSVDSTGRARPRRRQSTSKPGELLVSAIKGAKTEPASAESTPPEGNETPKQDIGDTPLPEPEPPRGDANDTTDAASVTDAATDAGETTDAAERTDAKEETSSTAKTGGRLRDHRLHIELAPFDTNAPLPSVPPTPHAQGIVTEDEALKPFSQMSQVSESEMSSGGGERSSILKTLTGLWAFRAGDFTPLEYPLSAAEHVFADSRVIVRENEPTSIIAFTLSSKQYREQMRSVMAAAKVTKARRHEPSLLDGIAGDGSRPWDIISVDEAMETDDIGRREVGTHLKYDFEAGSSTISCRIFFAEQFAALRQSCQCEDMFVESLARCAKFDASGGKSGSAFLKTKDDRFIVKEISRFEMDSITKFAPAYFEYTSTAFQRGRPTVLAKTYGIFKIGYRNAVTGRAMHMNVLVQENLFYARQFSRIYDLKGSTRNRLIKPTGKPNEVLLDENLMEIVHTAPLYLRDHSKRILRTALWNDTLFLSNLNVMDYSLVVGVDDKRGELVVGVVDYIRTFTWDKKVESWVKDLGGGGREPTIVTPLQYRKRFRTAMERFYFPSVPDRWAVAGADEVPLDEESATLLTM